MWCELDKGQCQHSSCGGLAQVQAGCRGLSVQVQLTPKCHHEGGPAVWQGGEHAGRLPKRRVCAKPRVLGHMWLV
jgi:hypothetical protein